MFTQGHDDETWEDVDETLCLSINGYGTIRIYKSWVLYICIVARTKHCTNTGTVAQLPYT